MLLALAALEAPLQLPLGDKGLYGEDCVFMANDWHASMVPVYLAAKYRAHGVYKNARSVMAIHNLRHQVCVGKCCWCACALGLVCLSAWP
jgi:starch synthase